MDGQVTWLDLGISCGKTWSEPLAATKEKTSQPCSKRSSKSSSRKPPVLKCLKRVGLPGEGTTMKWEDDGAWCGELTTRNTGECPNAVVVSRLSQILEETPHPKYNLTAKACQGILRRAERRGKDLPKLLKEVLIRQSQGASPQERTEATAPTEAPTSYAVRIRGGCDGGGKGALVQTEKSGTLGTGNDQTIFCLQGNGIDRADTAGCNGKGWREDASYTLNTIDRPAVCAEVSCMTPWDAQSQRVYDGNGVSPTLSSRENSGLNREAVLCAGFKLGNSEQARSIGYQEELSPTLNAECGGNKPAVVAPAVALDMTHACDVIRECGEQVPALQARMGTGGNQVPLTYGIGNGQANEASIMAEEVSQTLNTMHDAQAVMCDDVRHALRAKTNCAYREDAETYPVQNMVVRRLTPLECERLQGFPDGWTDIGDWVKTDKRRREIKVKGSADSPRYKALGNSIALPFWDWMLRRMARYLPEGATLGSLFDGISGFNVCWARIHGAECCRWSSEIEQFPIAVTKKHFGDEEAGKEGDWWKFLGM
nr:MAG TPA: Cytosine specific methyltransferase [Caudoviricetes sp.]